MKVVHSWLKDYLGDALPTPEQVAELLTFHSFEIDGIEEVEGEMVIDISVLPNRASDCLCHRGVARELASLLSVPLAYDPLAIKSELATTDTISITIEDATQCPRFSASLVTGIEVKDSPDWLKSRLAALGVRSINNIVDATNYVMFALGEPLHAYDADLFAQTDGKWNFVIRRAKEGETVSLLAEAGKTEDRVVELQGTELLIVDAATDTPIGLAGVKGGRYAGVHAGTKNILIEAAHFNPVTTRKTARRLGIVIDASKRFENEPARELVPYAQAEVVKLITAIAGGSYKGTVDVYLEEKPNPEVTVSVAKANALLGLTLTAAEMRAIMERIGATVISFSEEEITAVGPFERNDLIIPEDFIEEIGRVHGLDKVVSVVPAAIPLVEVNRRQYYTEAIRQALLQIGFSEVITSSFTNKADIQLQNALASDKSYVRKSLRKNITGVLDANFVHADLIGVTAIKVFEIGTVFSKTDTSVTEHTAIALGVRTKGNGYNQKDDAPLQRACAVVYEALGTPLDWNMEKGVAEANLSIALEKLPTPDRYQSFVSKPPAIYQTVSVYPAVSRDIALFVEPGESAAAVEETIRAAAGDLCVRSTLFDTFTKDGRTSYAFRLVFQSPDKTLTDQAVNAYMETIYQVVAEKGWEVR